MAVTNDVLEERIKHLTKQVETATALAKKASEEVEAFEKLVETRERKHLITGISILGSTVLALAGVIWNYRSVILK